MAKFDGTTFTKAATPKMAGQLRLDNRIIGQNPRKRKLTEMPGTNPKKLGDKELDTSSGAGRTKGGMTSSTAPFKHQAVDYPIGVGGPGFDDPTKP